MILSSQAILLDIEGTTTPIAFVTETLFPYARTHLASYLHRHRDSPACAELLARLHAERAAEWEANADVPAWHDSPGDARVASAVACAGWLMDRDRKSPALKELQGRVWEEGYERGELVGHVFADVPPALERWHRAGIPVGIFSSGSVRAQQWLFRRSSAGDLTPFLRWYFDTGVGPKHEAASYTRIAAAVNVAPAAILFISDVVGELDAAKRAGMRTTMSDRPGNARQPAHDHPVIHSFDEIPGARA